MLQINQVKLKLGFNELDLRNKVSTVLKVNSNELSNITILKQSIDARKKNDIFWVLSLAVDVNNENNVIKKCKSKDVTKYIKSKYDFVPCGFEELKSPPVVVGAGPCGLFAAYMLALNGYKPIVIERGEPVEFRTKDVDDFWNNLVLKPDSNVLFGEGGAGTFSDGKLNTLVKDKNGRNTLVLDVFTSFGAPEKIKYDAKPHIGTDVLVSVIKNMREFIISKGGEFRFNNKLTDIVVNNNKVEAIILNDNERLDCEVLLLCIGHSARDTFRMLYDKGISLEQKNFAVGFRVQHPQDIINKALYTDDESVLKKLPPAAYKLAYQGKKRGIYSFCMCPGGYVVNSSSEDNMLCINGMSYSKRDGENANSAIVVTVSNEDFESNHPLAGIEYQRNLEKRAYALGKGLIPTETYKDFKEDLGVEYSDKETRYSNTTVNPQFKGSYRFAKVSDIFPREINELFVEGMEYFDRIIPGFAMDNALVSGVEARTSSPVRITRNDLFESVNVNGLYPGGEGAGYAGGITSAAMDGIKLFEAVASKYKCFD